MATSWSGPSWTAATPGPSSLTPCTRRPACPSTRWPAACTGATHCSITSRRSTTTAATGTWCSAGRRCRPRPGWTCSRTACTGPTAPSRAYSALASTTRPPCRPCTRTATSRTRRPSRWCTRWSSVKVSPFDKPFYVPRISRSVHLLFSHSVV